MTGDVTVIRLDGLYYILEKSGRLAPLDPRWGKPERGCKMKYPEKNATMFYINNILHFVLSGGNLWSLVAYKWRRPSEIEWSEGHAGGYLPVCKEIFEVRSVGGKDIYRVDRDGYELVQEKTIGDMIKGITDRVGFIERRKQVVFALLPERDVQIGCVEAIKVLEDAKLITTVHDTAERSLYMVLKNKVDEKHFENHQDTVCEVYKKVVTP